MGSIIQVGSSVNLQQPSSATVSSAMNLWENEEGGGGGRREGGREGGIEGGRDRGREMHESVDKAMFHLISA